MLGNQQPTGDEGVDSTGELQNDRRFRLFAEAIPLIVWTARAEGDRDYHNRRWHDYSGMTPEESAGAGWMAAVHPHDRERCRLHWSEIRRTAHPIDFEYRLRRADGVYRWFLARAEPIRDDEGRVVRWFGTYTDIDDRKQAEDQTLRRSEGRFRLAAEAVDGLIYEWDLATDRVERTPGLAAVTGFRPEEAEPTGDWWRRRVHPDDLPALIEGHEASVARGEPLYEAEYRILHRDGQYRHVRDRARADYDADGRLAGVVGFTIDVSALRQAEAALRESRARLQALAESDVIGILFGDIRGGISYANDEYLRIIGYSRREFEEDRIGWATVTPPEWLAVDERAIAHANSGDGSCPPYEKEYVRKDGSRIPVLVGFTLYGATETVAFILDISEHKQAEREIHRLNQDLVRRAALLQALFDVLPVGIGIAEDTTSRNIVVNPALARILRLEPGANASLSAPEGERPDTFRIHRDGRELSPEELPLEIAAARGLSSHDIELDVVYPDGSTLNLLESAAPLLDEEGRPRGAVGTFLDITARKRAEAALREADRRKDEFLATLAHELRNPLATIASALRLLGMEGGGEGDRGMALEIAERQMRLLTRLVDDLLDVSRIASGKLQLRTERVEAATVIEGAVSAVRGFLDPRGHRLTVSVAPVPMPMAGDPTRLEQVLANLLNNAAKYSDPGSRIAIDSRPEGDEVVFRVRDEGIGIAPEMLPGIFAMFAQVDGSRERSHGGLGIGLKLVRELTEMHGGCVIATSEGPGKGSEFVVRIPRLPEAVELARPSHEILLGDSGEPPETRAMNNPSREARKTPDPAPPIGDPPRSSPPVGADRPMQDPFTEQVTHPAGEGQGANRPQPRQGAVGEDEGEAGPVEAGFSPVP